jgi:hypothetical protein
VASSPPAKMRPMARTEIRPIHHRYVAVLVLILISITFQLAAPDTSGARLVSVLLQAITLLAAVYVSRAHTWIVRAVLAICAALVLIAVGTVLGTEEYGGDAARVISVLLVALAPPMIVLGMRDHFREQGGITLQTMFGVLCIYLLIGMLFSTVYGAIVSVTDDPFFKPGQPEETSDFLYFSFSTLTTTGFGDLVAATNLGRSLSVAEALIGQIYLVTVVALIVANLGPARPRGIDASGRPPGA